MLQNDILVKSLFKKHGLDILIKHIQPIFGGCINNSYKINTNQGVFFLKLSSNSIKDLFLKENNALELINSTNTISVPEVICCNNEMLLLEFIAETTYTDVFWDSFAMKLASMHMIKNDRFGLDHNNYIGTLDQSNIPTSTWVDFFINQRILPQLNIGCFSSDIRGYFDQLFVKLDNIFPLEKPSLIHGDLWSGNFLCYNNDAFLIDPAVYFGFREMDIAMTKMFGGFDSKFYETYHYYFPLEEDWEYRVNICNLYPLLVHANLFGGAYHIQIKNILKSVI